MPFRSMIRLQGKVARREAASPAATELVIGGNWPLPVKRVLSTKVSCGRTNGARPSWLGSVLNCVQVLTFPWVLIRISIVNRVRGRAIGGEAVGRGRAGLRCLGGRGRRRVTSRDQKQREHPGSRDQRDSAANAS